MQLVSISCLHQLLLSQTFSAALASPRARTAAAAVRPPDVQTFHPPASLGPSSGLPPAAWAARCQQQAWRTCHLTPAASAWRTGEQHQPALAHLHADLWLTCLVLNLCHKSCVSGLICFCVPHLLNLRLGTVLHTPCVVAGTGQLLHYGSWTTTSWISSGAQMLACLSSNSEGAAVKSGMRSSFLAGQDGNCLLLIVLAQENRRGQLW